MSDIQEVYTAALDSLLTKVRADTYIVAAVLVGSLAYDTVWQRSNIDLVLVTEEGRQEKDAFKGRSPLAQERCGRRTGAERDPHARRPAARARLPEL